MPAPEELRALAERCKAVENLPEHLRNAELQLIDREIRDFGLVDETRSFRFYTRDLSMIQLLVPPGYDWSLFSDGMAGCARQEVPVADVAAMTPELALLAAALEAQAQFLEEMTK